MLTFACSGTHNSHFRLFSKVVTRGLFAASLWLTLGSAAAAATPPCTLNTADPSVTICTPAPNATVTSPVHVVAGTTSSKTVTVIQIYVDGVKATQGSSGTIDTNVSMAAGTHRLTVQAYNGAWFKSTENITVSTASSSCTLNTTDPSVTICTPAPNATVDSPVHVVAGTTSSKTVSFTQIYVDGVKATQVSGGKIDTSVSMAAGAHRLTVQAYNGTYFKSTENITVSGSTGGGGGGGGNFSGIFTYKNDNSRTGQNLQESVLTPANVKSTTFGKRFSFAVDGNVFAQPLYVPNLSVNGVTRNVLFIATEHDSVYAFDADGKTLSPLWKRSFIDPANNINPVAACQSCGRTALGAEVGVTGTPVIDKDTDTIYVSAMTNDNGTIKHSLHALDLQTGAEKFGSPKVVQASVPGKGAGTDGVGNVPFVNDTANQRSGLLLLNGVVYVSWAAFSDVEPYHGWMIGYNATSLEQTGIFNATPDTSAGGIWAGGCAPAADSNGNIHVMTGNGHFDSAGKEYGQSFLKLNAQMQVVDYFTPYNWQTINSTDLDIGSGCPALLPNQAGTAHPNLIVSGTKDGKIYLVDRDNMGKFQSGSNSQIPQTINLNPASVTSGTRPRMYSSPAFLNGHVYIATANGNLKSYALSNSHLTLSSQSGDHFTSRGPIPVVSANGPSNGIVWLADRITSSGIVVLRAYSASSVTSQIYSSSQNSTRDSMGTGFPFTVPTVANGRVYVPSKGKINVFGLLP